MTCDFHGKTMVVLSGGMDSTTLLWLAAQHVEVEAVTINYGQRHKKELIAARTQANRLEIPHHVVELPELGRLISRGSLTNLQENVPEGHYTETSMKATVVPNRNMMLLSIAGSIAISNGCRGLAYGAHTGDHDIYPDCRQEFVKAMKEAFALCDYKPLDLVSPFQGMSKTDIVKLGLKIGVDYSQTWTCYKGRDIACGRCGTCVERLEAFYEAGAVDPLDYEDRESWKIIVMKHAEL